MVVRVARVGGIFEGVSNRARERRYVAVPIREYICPNSKCGKKLELIVVKDQARSCPECGTTMEEQPPLPAPFQWSEKDPRWNK